MEQVIESEVPTATEKQQQLKAEGREGPNRQETLHEAQREAQRETGHYSESPAWTDTMSLRDLDDRFPFIADGLMLLGGAANIIMQLAYPPVGYGVYESPVESGRAFLHPFKRTRTTFTYLAVAVAGTPEEKRAYRKAVNTAHVQVKSTDKSPAKYNALDPDLQMWVAACLCWGWLDTWQKFYGPADRASLDILYERMTALGTTLQVKQDMWPKDVDAFNAYFEQGLQRTRIDWDLRGYLDGVTDMDLFPWYLRLPFQGLNRFMTIGLLPPKLRCEMGYLWNEGKQQRFDRLVRFLALLNRPLPRLLRQAPLALVLWDFRRRIKANAQLV